jgi:hypothetical protein
LFDSGCFDSSLCLDSAMGQGGFVKDVLYP